MDQMDQELEELILEETNSPFTVPTLEEVLRLADDGTALADHLGMSLRQMGMHKELLRRLGNLAFRAMKDMKHCYIGGSYSRRTALKYHFDVDLVLFIRGFNHNKNKVYQTQLYDGLERLLYHALQLKGASLQSMTLCSGFAEFNLLITGEAAPEKLPSNERKFYAAAYSRTVDEEVLSFAARHPEFRPFVLLVKHWKYLGSEKIDISSYHLELLCMEIIRQHDSDCLRDLFWWFLKRVAYSDNRLCVKNLNRFKNQLQVSNEQMTLLALYAQETLREYQWHIRQRSNAVCVSCHRPSTSVAASRYRPL